MTWAITILVFVICVAFIAVLAFKIGEEKVRDDETDDERHDENHRQ